MTSADWAQRWQHALMDNYGTPPVMLVRGVGARVWDADGREYVITLEPGQSTPAPWVNVLANPHFGTVVSESGGSTLRLPSEAIAMPPVSCRA